MAADQKGEVSFDFEERRSWLSSQVLDESCDAKVWSSSPLSASLMKIFVIVQFYLYLLCLYSFWTILRIIVISWSQSLFHFINFLFYLFAFLFIVQANFRPFHKHRHYAHRRFRLPAEPLPPVLEFVIYIYIYIYILYMCPFLFFLWEARASYNIINFYAL